MNTLQLLRTAVTTCFSVWYGRCCCAVGGVILDVFVLVHACFLFTECSPCGSGHIQLRSSQQAESYQRPAGSNSSSTL